MMMMRKQLICACLAALFSYASFAEENYLDDARAEYPNIIGTQLNTCSLCHSTGNNLNSYGSDYKNHSRNFAMIESDDSDGDTYSNIVEINAETFPGNSNSVPAEPATIRVKSPNGGETLTQGQKVQIKWITTGDAGANVNIELWQAGAKVKNLKSGVANDGKQKVSVPSNVGTGADFKVKVVSATDSGVSDSSNSAFTIAPPTP